MDEQNNEDDQHRQSKRSNRDKYDEGIQTQNEREDMKINLENRPTYEEKKEKYC